MKTVNPRRKWVKRTILILLLGIFGFAGVWGYMVAKSFAGNNGSIRDVFEGLTNPRAQFPAQDRITILIIGKDYNHDKKGMPYSKDARADTIMLLSADLNSKRLAAVSIPRDTYILTDEGHAAKINSTLQRGGVEAVKSALNRQFGVQPDYYVLLKDTAVKEIVDAVGGVDVEAIDDMFYDDSWAGLHIDIKKGRHHLSGEEAIGFVRFRKWGTHKVDAEGRKISVPRRESLEEGDIRRTERQQQLLRSLMAEAKSFRNIVRAPKIIDVGFSQIETDLTRTQVLALAQLFKGDGTTGMASAVIPGADAYEDRIYYYKPDPERARLTVQWIIDGDESAGRKLVRVAVYNSTKVGGAAVKAATNLSNQGFSAFSAGSTSDHPEHTEIVYRKAAHQAYAEELARLLGGGEVKKDTGDPRADWRPEVKIVLASDTAEQFKKQSGSASQTRS